MAMPRRRLVRPTATATDPDPGRTQRLQKLRKRLDQERMALGRWMARLKRAFHSMEKHQTQVARLDRVIRNLEE